MADKVQATQRVDYDINEQLNQRIRKRIGQDNAVIRISEQSWDYGFCHTCSMPEDGFAVYANDRLVWPSEDYLQEFGGYIYADDNGSVARNTLSVYGQFNAWLNGIEWYEDE